MIEELPVGQRAVVKPKAPSQLDKVEILTQPPLAEMQANEERWWNLLQEYEQRFEKLPEDQRLSRLCSEASLRLLEIGSSMLFRHPEEKKINLYAENRRCFEINKELVSKGGSKAMYDLNLVSDIKTCNHNGGYSIEVQVQSLFQDQTVSWIRIVNGIDKFVREALPIQEEEKASDKPAAKARPRLNPSATSGWDFTPIEQRKWIDIET